MKRLLILFLSHDHNDASRWVLWKTRRQSVKTCRWNHELYLHNNHDNFGMLWNQGTSFTTSGLKEPGNHADKCFHLFHYAWKRCKSYGYHQDRAAVYDVLIAADMSSNSVFSLLLFLRLSVKCGFTCAYCCN